MDIFYENQDLEEQTILFARQYGFQSQGLICPNAFKKEILYLTTEGLQICIPDTKPSQIDFLSAARQHRRIYGGKETLVKACGIKKDKKPITIIDATAGYGKDAFVLACYGANVILVEQHPVMAALLEDALKRFYAHTTLSHNVSLTLYCDNTVNFLKTLDELPDVIYWDPMHPSRQKSAQVKKDMAFLQQWVAPETELESLIQLSLPYAKDRVVLKWPRKAPGLNSIKPNFIYEEKTVRFEVFKNF